MTSHVLPLGKLPVDLAASLLERVTISDPRVRLGPGVGLDCAILDMGETLLAIKTDPITFATDEIGWYAVQVNANDVATTGAAPRWFTAVLLLPEGKATPALAESIYDQLEQACHLVGASLIGGHTEVTGSLDRPIIVGTMMGEVARERLVTPRGARPGDRLLLTKGVPIEATAILAREYSEKLTSILTSEEIIHAQDFLHRPGIGVLKEAQIATANGRVSAMHDPTEGGLAGALWELALASRVALSVNSGAIPIPLLSQKVCAAFHIDPLSAIASGALLLAAPTEDASTIRHAIEGAGIACHEIGEVEAGEPAVWQVREGVKAPLARPQRDAIARLFEK